MEKVRRLLAAWTLWRGHYCFRHGIVREWRRYSGYVCEGCERDYTDAHKQRTDAALAVWEER